MADDDDSSVFCNSSIMTLTSLRRSLNFLILVSRDLMALTDSRRSLLWLNYGSKVVFLTENPGFRQIGHDISLLSTWKFVDPDDHASVRGHILQAPAFRRVLAAKLARACGVSAVGVRAVDCWQRRSGHYFHPYFFPPPFFSVFFPRFSSVATFSHRRTARIKKLI